jgi:hypothetical protein
MKAKFVKDILNEKIISIDPMEIDIDFGIQPTFHSAFRQGRHRDEFIETEEIRQDLLRAFDKMSKELLFDIIDIGEPVLIRNRDSHLNIVGVPYRSGAPQGIDNQLGFKVITVMRKEDFENRKDAHEIQISNSDPIMSRGEG